MISRVADHCFWFGRYIERGESTARLLQVTRALAFDSSMPVTQCWQPLMIVSGQLPAFSERFSAQAAVDGETVEQYMTWSLDNPVSLVSSLRAARESARIIRDVLSLDAWEEVNELYHFLNRDSTRRMHEHNREEFYRSVRRSTQLVLGLVRSTMLHDRPMSFLWLGVMLERVGQIARILDMHHHILERESVEHDIVQTALWLSLLRACSGAEGFMKKQAGRISAQAVVSFLLLEPGFPRSLTYCLRSAQKILGDIWPESPRNARPSTRRLEALVARLASQSLRTDAGVHELLTEVVDETSAICGEIGGEIEGIVSEDASISSVPQ